MKNILASLVVLALLLPAYAFAADNLKLAVVDVQEVLDSIEEGKQAKQTLESDRAAKEKELEGKKTQFTKMKMDYEKQKLILSQDALMEKQKELQELAQQIQGQLFNYNDQLNKKYNEILLSIYRKIESVVTKIATENKYTMVLEKGEGRGVMYAQKAFDITKKVITVYNKEYASKGAKKK